MTKGSSKAEMHEKKKQTRNSATAKGLYDKVRSKWVKGADGYGAVISVAREKLLDKSHGKAPEGAVAFHLQGGAHNNHSTADEGAIWSTKGQNTAESNMRRAGESEASIKKKLHLKGWK